MDDLRCAPGVQWHGRNQTHQMMLSPWFLVTGVNLGRN